MTAVALLRWFTVVLSVVVCFPYPPDGRPDLDALCATPQGASRQVEHHVFPDLPSNRYRGLAGPVRVLRLSLPRATMGGGRNRTGDNAG